MSVSGFIFCTSGAVVLAPSVGRTTSALRCCLWSRVRDDLMLFMQVCFQALCSVPLTHFSLLPASPHALGDCSFRGCLRLDVSVLQPGSSPIQCFSIHWDWPIVGSWNQFGDFMTSILKKESKWNRTEEERGGFAPNKGKGASWNFCFSYICVSVCMHVGH